MCELANCCPPVCGGKGKGRWAWMLAAALAVAFALVCALAYAALKVDSFVLWRPARFGPSDLPVIVLSWWSPAARHQLAAAGLVLPVGPDVLQVTMLLLVFIPAAAVAVWLHAGRPVLSLSGLQAAWRLSRQHHVRRHRRDTAPIPAPAAAVPPTLPQLAPQPLQPPQRAQLRLVHDAAAPSRAGREVA